jgi:hypothetical protein
LSSRWLFPVAGILLYSWQDFYFLKIYLFLPPFYFITSSVEGETTTPPWADQNGKGVKEEEAQ